MDGYFFDFTEEAVTEADPSLKRKLTMTVRDYVAYLLRKCPGLDRELCSYYVYIYERARFDRSEFDLEEWREFVEKFQKLLDYFAEMKEGSKKSNVDSEEFITPKELSPVSTPGSKKKKKKRAKTP